MSEIEPRHFETAQEFISALRRSDPYWLSEKDDECRWIFRGQKCDSLDLRPSAWRSSSRDIHPLYVYLKTKLDIEYQIKRAQSLGAFSSRGWDSQPERIGEWIYQSLFELTLLYTFAELVDELGFPLPDGFPETAFRLELDPLYTDPFGKPRNFQPFHPLLGVAQHHGLPTRLIDWTLDPRFAAFFAIDFDDSVGKGKNVVVWAANRDLLEDSGWNTFTVKRSQIGFLHAQQGLFTYHEGADGTFLSTGIWPSMDQDMPAGSIRKLTLPKSEAKELKKLLWIDRVTRAHLMPTHDNVARALESEWKRNLFTLKAEVERASTGTKE